LPIKEATDEELVNNDEFVKFVQDQRGKLASIDEDPK
jgi:hypothetical protein